MKNFLIIILTFASIALMGQNSSFYDFSVKDIDGNTFDFNQLKGKKVMVVNTASKCGLTPQYEDLEKLYKQYKDDNFIIIGFPANNFLKQEPGSNTEIKQFCTSEYQVSFPMMAKISVKGDDIDPLYKWLCSKDLNGTTDAKISWNFQKFLISPEGNIDHVMSPRTSPTDSEITDWIEE